MADDWKPGDLALCVKMGRWRHLDDRTFCTGPKAGEILTVRAVAVHPTDGMALWFVGWPGNQWGDSFDPHRFRKIRPHTPDAEDIRTIALLTGKPVKESA